MDEQHETSAGTLFDLPAAEAPVPEATAAPARPRLQRPDRAQVRLRPVDLESLLPDDHRVRLVWDYVATLDLSGFHARVRSLEGGAGRPAIDPALLVALWLYATLEGVGSARALARLCDEHDAYRWLCGGVGVNHHTLADFRVEGAELLDRLLAESVAALVAGGGARLERVAHDGVRVRASAGSSSYRTRDGLAEALSAAEAQVTTLRAELEADAAATTRRQAAARERAARERLERVQGALAALDAIAAGRRAHRPAPKQPQASTTDPEARFIKMADGGFRPAWNCQISADMASGAVLRVAVHDGSTDAGQLPPAIDDIAARYGTRPAAVLADGGYGVNADIEAISACGTVPYIPIRQRGARRTPPRYPDTPVITGWRERMGTPEATDIYRERGAVIEWVNALARNRGLQQFRVRGREKVRAVLLWFGLAHNLAIALRRRALAAAV
jgi:transposase